VSTVSRLWHRRFFPSSGHRKPSLVSQLQGCTPPSPPSGQDRSILSHCQRPVNRRVKRASGERNGLRRSASVAVASPVRCLVRA